jgi:hypothetical protein
MKTAYWSLFPLLAGSLWANEAPTLAPVKLPSIPDVVFIRAIHDQRVVSFNYGGHPRTVEPHAYGVATTGDVVLHGFQTAGGSVSGKPPGWRTFNTAEIRDLAVTEASFARMRADYSAERPKLEPLWAEVAPPAIADPASTPASSAP